MDGPSMVGHSGLALAPLLRVVTAHDDHNSGEEYRKEHRVPSDVVQRDPAAATKHGPVPVEA